MSKQLKQTTEVLEKQAMRIKSNFRVGLTTKSAIIADSEKSISSSIRSGIIQLLCDACTNASVDMITCVASMTPSEVDSVNFSDVKEKYTVTREGDFINCQLNNLLTNIDKLDRLSELTIVLYKTDVDTFEVSSDRILIQIPSYFDSDVSLGITSNFILLYIFNQLRIKL